MYYKWYCKLCPSCFVSSVVRAVIKKQTNKIKGKVQLSVQVILKKIGQWLSEGSGWSDDSVDSHYLTIVKYKPMKGSSYIKLPSELQHHVKGLINLKYKDNECFRWCHIRHLNPQENDSQRIKISDKAFVSQLNYDVIEFPVKVNDYNKIE